METPKTVKRMAEEYGTVTAIKWADHRAECLESRVRFLRQALRAVSGAVLAGDIGRAMFLAQESLDELSDDASDQEAH